MTSIPAHVSDSISASLNDIAEHFQQPKITLLVRAPQLDDGDVVMTNDDLEDALAAIERFRARHPKGE